MPEIWAYLRFYISNANGPWLEPEVPVSHVHPPGAWGRLRLAQGKGPEAGLGTEQRLHSKPHGNQETHTERDTLRHMHARTHPSARTRTPGGDGCH